MFVHQIIYWRNQPLRLKHKKKYNCIMHLKLLSFKAKTNLNDYKRQLQKHI
jgi:hypothetical protein